MADTLTSAPEESEFATSAPTTNPAADAPANQQKNFASRPMTGDEYIESLRDGREVYLHGDGFPTSPRTPPSATPCA